MKFRNQTLSIDGITVHLTRKRVKHLRLVVSPPDGRVRVSVPASVPAEVVWRFLEHKLDWIRCKQARFAASVKTIPPQFSTGEHHYYQGRPHRLQVLEQAGRPQVTREGNELLLQIRPGSDAVSRGRVLDEWYRSELKQQVPSLLETWQPRTGKSVSDWGIKKMKTRWGSCNIHKCRIWLNLELAKYPPQALEYVLVHELVHLLERYHNDRFREFMDRFIPDWRLQKQALNSCLRFIDGLDD